MNISASNWQAWVEKNAFPLLKKRSLYSKKGGLGRRKPSDLQYLKTKWNANKNILLEYKTSWLNIEPEIHTLRHILLSFDELACGRKRKFINLLIFLFRVIHVDYIWTGTILSTNWSLKRHSGNVVSLVYLKLLCVQNAVKLCWYETLTSLMQTSKQVMPSHKVGLATGRQYRMASGDRAE